MLVDMYEYYRMLKENNISVIYSGPIWADGIEGIALAMKKRLGLDELPLSAEKSVFSVFVEQMNNILMYSADKEKFQSSSDVSVGVLFLGVKDESYFVQSGNVVKNDSIDLIKARIDHLNTLDKPALRRFFKEKLKEEDSNPESKGAGLGLIEIAKRASSKIEYGFRPLKDDLSFFTMLVTIDREEK